MNTAHTLQQRYIASNLMFCDTLADLHDDASQLSASHQVTDTGVSLYQFNDNSVLEINGKAVQSHTNMDAYEHACDFGFSLGVIEPHSPFTISNMTNVMACASSPIFRSAAEQQNYANEARKAPVQFTNEETRRYVQAIANDATLLQLACALAYELKTADELAAVLQRDMQNDIADTPNGLMAEMLRVSVSRINWLEVAEHIIANMPN